MTDIQYIDLTPTWQEILPTRLNLYRMAVRGEVGDPHTVKNNAEAEFRRMAEAADRWNAQGKRSSDIHRVVNELEQWFLDDGDLSQLIFNLMTFQRAWASSTSTDENAGEDPHEVFQRTLLNGLETEEQPS